MNIEPQKKDIKSLLVTLAFSTVFFGIGMYLCPFIFENIVPQVEGVVIVASEPYVSGMFKLQLSMGVAFAIIPAAIYSAWTILKVKSVGLKAFFTVVILAFVFGVLALRALMLNNIAKEMSAISISPDRLHVIPVSSIRAAEFAMAGIFVGWIVAVVCGKVFMKKPTTGSSPKTT